MVNRLSLPMDERDSYFKKSLWDEFSVIYKPAFIPPHQKMKKFTSVVSRLACVCGVVITVCVFPFEETYHLANTIKKMSAFPSYLISFVSHCLAAQAIDKIEGSKKLLIKKWKKLTHSLALTICLPAIRAIYILRLLAAAILHPRIAY